MAKLATRLQGITNYNEHIQDIEETRYIRRVYAAVIKLAVKDLETEVKRGIDITTKERYNVSTEGSLPLDRPPKTSNSTSGRKRRPILSPYHFIFGNDGTFTLCCQELGLDPEHLRRGISSKILGVRKNNV